MKYLLIIFVILPVIFLTGCATSPFNVTHLERITCDNGASTPYANWAERADDRIVWDNNRNWGRTPSLSVPKRVPCSKQVMSKEKVELYND